MRRLLFKTLFSTFIVVVCFGGSVTAAAGNYSYWGGITTCLSNCDSFEALGGPGGASNAVPSEVSGTIWINATSSHTWGFDDTVDDAGAFFGGLEIFNPAAPVESAIFAPDPDVRCDGLASGTLCNPTTANPLPLDSRVAEIRETATTPSQTYATGGTTDATGGLDSGTLLFEFVVAPFNGDSTWLVLDLATGGGQVCEFFPASDCIPTATESVVIAGIWYARDTDQDGHLDPVDNCICQDNAIQRDTNIDGFGNICDTDLNDDHIVNVLDLGLLKQLFFTTDADADFNGDGVVNVQDLARMKQMFFSPPGPSGFHPIDNDDFCQVNPSAPTAVACWVDLSGLLVCSGDPNVSSVTPEVTVQLDGLQSTDPDLDALFYDWRLAARPAGSAATISDPSIPTPTLFVDVVGSYPVCLTVTDTTGLVSPEACVTVYVGDPDLHMQLVWDTAFTDLDLHFLHPNGTWTNPVWDCYSRNNRPNWGDPGSSTDDPGLDIDDVDGWGPENINIEEPEEGLTYKVAVHFVADHGGGPTIPRLRIFLRGLLVYDKSASVLPQDGYFWEVAEITWSGGTAAIMEIDQITPTIP